MKPFAAAELLARVRANVELARLRNHHARWRTALVDSLQEAFFVCDEHGAVIEVNTAFTDDPRLRPGRSALRADAPVVARRRHRARSPPGRSPRRSRAAQRLARHLSRFRSPQRRTPTVGHGEFHSRRRPRHRPACHGRHVPRRHRRALHDAKQTALATLNQALAQADTLDDASRSRQGTARAVAGAVVCWPSPSPPTGGRRHPAHRVWCALASPCSGATSPPIRDSDRDGARR